MDNKVFGMDPSMAILGFLFFAYFCYWAIVLFRTWSKKYYIRSWDGTKDSAQFKKGGLWWGHNDRTGEWFFIYNGTVCWQVQSWAPTIAVWGVTYPWERFRFEKKIQDISYAEMLSTPAVELGKLPKNSTLRRQLEAEMQETVEKKIRLARALDPMAVALLMKSMKAKPYQVQGSFSAWYTKHGVLLGVRECYKIGISTCKRHGFTLSEAVQLSKRIATRHDR